MSTAGAVAPRPGLGTLVRRAWVYESGQWRSLARWLSRRRPVVPAGAEPFPYVGVLLPIMWTFVVISAVEIPLVHVLVPWPMARTVLLVVGVYGVVWQLGQLAALTLHPHLVDGEGLRVRLGSTVDLLVPWTEIAGVASQRRSTEGMRFIQVLDEGAGRVLSVAMGNQTTVEVVLRRPLPLLAARGDAEPVAVVRLHADDHAALVRRLRAGVDRRPVG